jgi:hypothetical protein
MPRDCLRHGTRWSPGQWSAQLRHDGGPALRLLAAGPDSLVSFVAVLVDDDQSHSTGIVSVVGALPGEAASSVQPIADRLTGEPVTLTAQRWTRGGRR